MAGPDDYFDTEAAKRMAVLVARDDAAAATAMIGGGKVGAFEIGDQTQSWLSIAIQAGAKATFVTLLREYGLRGASREAVGQALYHAVVADDDYWLQALHAAGADLNNHGGGDLLLMIAARTRIPERLEFFIANGADLEAKTTFGDTAALMLSVTASYPQLIRLLEAGASPWAASSQGRTIGYWLEKKAENPVWDFESETEAQRQRVIDMLVAAGVPHPPPAPEEILRLIDAGEWGQ